MTTKTVDCTIRTFMAALFDHDYSGLEGGQEEFRDLYLQFVYGISDIGKGQDNAKLPVEVLLHRQLAFFKKYVIPEGGKVVSLQRDSNKARQYFISIIDYLRDDIFISIDLDKTKISYLALIINLQRKCVKEANN